MDIATNSHRFPDANILIKRSGEATEVKYFENFDAAHSAIKQEIEDPFASLDSINLHIKTEVVEVEDDDFNAEDSSTSPSEPENCKDVADKSLEIDSTHISDDNDVVEPFDLIRRNIAAKLDAANISEPFLCDRCGYIAQTDKCLEIHMRIHPRLKKCAECNFVATNKYQWRVHMKQMHSGVTPYKCNECDYTTMKKAHLLKHAISHTGDKPFVCENCDFRTSKQALLNRHMKIHTGKNLFYCDSCDYKTNQKSGIQQHLRKHTGERPFKCSSCEYSARTAHQLKVHVMRNHSGVSPYQCTECGLKTGDKTKLTVHMRIHTGEKPFECDLCGYKLSQKSSLVRHKKTHDRLGQSTTLKRGRQKRLPFEQVFWVTKEEPDSSTET